MTASTPHRSTERTVHEIPTTKFQNTALQNPALLCLMDSKRCEVIPLQFQNNEVLIGRANNCDIVFALPGISRYHAKLVQAPDKSIHLVDLGSYNGTFVNQTRIQKKRLKPNDNIHLSISVLFKLVYLEQLDTNIDFQIHSSLLKQLADSEKRYRELIENIHEVIVILDKSGRLEFVNQAWCRTLEYDKNESIGRTFAEFANHQEKQIHHLLPKYPKEGTTRNQELRCQTKNGDCVWLALSSRFHNGKWFVNASDVSHQKKAKKELQRAKKLAEDANLAKSAFLANMSHEIRTPLNAVLGMTELTLDTKLTTLQREYLEVVQMNSGLLLHILNDVLDLSKIEASQMEFEKLPFSLRGIFACVEETFRVAAENKGLQLMLSVQSCIPDKLLGDPNRLQQILYNLVSNAIKFTSIGIIHIEVTQNSHIKNNQLELTFSISDTGMGISEEDQKKVFDQFFQVRNPQATLSGTGLGLSIVRSLVKGMGGEISLKSKKNQGSTFKFQLPFQRHLTPPTPTANKAKETIKQRTIQKVQILLVEDYVDNQKLIQGILEKKNFHIDIAQDGFLALEAIEKKQYDLVLMDLQMPGKSGFHTTQEIRAFEHKHSISQVPIVALTAHALKGYRSKCIEHGMNDYLSKPFSSKELLRVIHENIDLRPRVLLVDDSSEIRTLVKTYTKRQLLDCQLVLASNGQEALAQLKRQHVSLILMDMEMPVLDGYETTKAIKNIQEYHKIKIVALTGHVGKSELQRCFDLGCCDHLEKPFSKKSLSEKVHFWLRSHSADTRTTDSSKADFTFAQTTHV